MIYSFLRSFAPQCITTNTILSDCDGGIFLDLHKTFWFLSLPIPQFIVSYEIWYLVVYEIFVPDIAIYLIIPSAMESSLTSVDVLLFAFRRA